tara:strand:- start:57 stop:527 length:471 start_codon:yes stop_codon:yes gene_type:complete
MGLLNKIEGTTKPKKIEKGNRKHIVKKISQKHTNEQLTPTDQSDPKFIKSTVQTDIDKLHSIILKYKKINIKDASTILKTKSERIEGLAKILNKYNIAELIYPSVGSPYIEIMTEEDQRQNKKEQNKKSNIIRFIIIILIVIAIIIYMLYRFNFIF